MSTIISPGQAFGRSALDDLVQRGFTRRHLFRVAALLGAGAALPFGSEHALAQLSDAGRMPEDAVKINANEFPEARRRRALEALAAVAKKGNRYQYPETDALVAMAAELEGLEPGALRRLSGLEPGAPPRGDRLHFAEARARHRRPRLRGGGERGASSSAPRSCASRSAHDGSHDLAGDAGRRQDAADRPLLRLQPEQPDGHGDAARATSSS